MNDNKRGEDEHVSINQQAREWVVRLDRDKSPETRAEFDEWFDASPEHRREFEWIEKIYAVGEHLKDSDEFGLKREADAPRPARSRHWLMWGTAAAAAVAVLMIAFGAGGAPLPGQSMSALAAEPLVTQRGEIRSFRLSDGTNATLDTDSRVEVSMTATERSLHLSQGRARFEVASDARPFRVRAGAGEVTASQGVLDVAYGDDQNITVRVISGEAKVGPIAPGPQAAPARPADQSEVLGYSVTDGRAVSVPPVVGANARQDWPSGWVQHRSIRLDQLVAQANRYSGKPIVLDDNATAALIASGRFQINKTDVFVERIAESLKLRISYRDDGIHLRKR